MAYFSLFLEGFMDAYQRLRDLREDHDLKQADIARLLQTTQEQISKYEMGKQMMGIDKYIKLAKYYNVSLDYLTGLIDTPRKLY
jgi:transcriptional regulator with XRE-family HTH domain